jgi:CRISPR-associated protein Cmr1
VKLLDKNILKLIYEVKLKVMTPLFLGNAQLEDVKNERINDIPSELRPPSLKGVLRFWHRAVGQDNLQTEAEYFGSTTGQSSFLLQVKNLPKIHLNKEEHWKTELGYLGYGPIIAVKKESEIKRKLLSRQYIEPGEDLVFRLVFRPDITPKVRTAVERSFRMLSLFGGLGSRSRRGFGSVVCKDMLFENIEALSQRIKSEFEQSSPLMDEKDLSYTAISTQTKVLLMEGNFSWEETLQKIGGLLLKFRSFRTKPPESKWPRNDHDLIFDFLTQNTITEAPARSVYGLPHNYYFSSCKLNAVVEGNNDQFIRRASPLFIHIHQLRTGRYIIVISFFPAQFLRKGISLNVKQKIKGVNVKTSAALEVPDWTAIYDFLHFLENKHGVLEVKWNHE